MRTDPLSDALQMVRPRLAAYDVGRLERSWGVRLQAVEGASFIAVGEGQTLLGAEPLRAPLRLGAGDAALLPHGAAACLKDRADRPLTAPGAHPFAAHAPVSSTRAVPSDPARRDGPSAVVITGIIEFDQRMAAPLLRSLPPVIHLPHRQTATGRWLAQSISLIGRKLQPPAPGSEALMAQCFGLFFTQTLCALAAGEARVLPSGVLPQGLIRGLRDAAITQALQAFHQASSSSWSVQQLAEAAHLARTTFATRFKAQMGVTPMHYVRQHRVLQAARFLEAHPAATVSEAAWTVGYASTSSFIKAFRREMGCSPSEHRTRVDRAAGATGRTKKEAS